MTAGRRSSLFLSSFIVALLSTSCERPAVAPTNGIRTAPVVVYAAYEDESRLPTLFQMYTEASGTRVTVRHGDTSVIVDDVIANRGSPAADVLLTSDVAGIWRAADEGALRPLTAVSFDDRLPEWLHDPDNFWYALNYRVSLIAYDSRIVDPADISSYQDLADARFRGQLCLTSSHESANRAVIAMLIGDLGVRPAEIIVRGWMANLALPVMDSEAELRDAIQSAACRIGILSSTAAALSAKGNADATMRSLTPDPSSVDIEGIGIARHTKNPEAAAALVEWMLSDPAQSTHARQTLSYPASSSAPIASILNSANRNNDSRRNISRAAWQGDETLRLAERAGYR